MRNFENYEVDENEYIENDFEVDCEEVEIKDTYKE